MVVQFADKNLIEQAPLNDDVNVSFDVNGNRTFSIQIARSNWREYMTFGGYVYVHDEEYGGKVEEVLTDTTLDYVELKGLTWRGRLAKKIIKPPSGTAYRKVTGELNAVLKELIEPEFDGFFVVSGEDTGVSVKDFQFDRYCTLLDGINKMLLSKGYKIRVKNKKEPNVPMYVFIEATPIVDHSKRIELSKDNLLQYTMDDYRFGVNHLVVTGRGEMAERTVMDMYVQNDGSISTKVQYYKGFDEIAERYENTSYREEMSNPSTDPEAEPPTQEEIAAYNTELYETSKEKLLELMSRKTFKMDIGQYNIPAEIGDIVGGRDYLTGLYASKPIANVIYSVTNGTEEINYKLDGEDEA